MGFDPPLATQVQLLRQSLPFELEKEGNGRNSAVSLLFISPHLSKTKAQIKRSFSLRAMPGEQPCYVLIAALGEC